MAPILIHARLDGLYIRRPRWVLVFILAGYLVCGMLFAIETPPWQNPDEPAHYNNIATIAQTGGMPVLHMGDYDQQTIGLLVSLGFPPQLSVDSLRYEAYQPPLYYEAAVPVFLATGGNLTALRLFNVLLGAISVVLLYFCVELVFPTKPLLSVGAAAFAAFLPMRVAMSASVNNDGLAEALLLAAMMVLLRWMRTAFYDRNRRKQLRAVPDNVLPLLVLGALLGLGMVTKIYAYVALVLVVGMVGLVVWLKPTAAVDRFRTVHPTWRGFKQALIAVLWVITPAVLIALPLWLRNIQLYGNWDFLGLGYHDAVVVGQPTTAAWLEQNGWMQFVERALTFTFRSFWGVFGWMGVFLDSRIYTILLVFTGIIFFGLLWALVRFISGRPETDMDRFQFWVLGFFVIMVLAVTASYVAYNVKFVQHQGRYFLWGILPISVFVALGWREVMQPLQGKVTGFLAGVLTLSLIAASFFVRIQDRLIIASLGFVSLLLILQPFLLSGAVDAIIIGAPYWLQRWLSNRRLQPLLAVLRTLAWATPFVLLFLLALVIPFWYIRPQLVRP